MSTRFLQYVSGGTIGRCLQEYGPFKEEITKSFTHQILEGIFYLHSKGIIHRVCTFAAHIVYVKIEDCIGSKIG